MKKLALLLAVILLFSFTGCKKQPAGNTDPTTTTTTAPYTPTRVDTFTVGAVNGTSYENAFFGIGCNLGSDWTITSYDKDSATAASAQYYSDMSATDTIGRSVEVYVENLSLLMDNLPTLEEYIALQRSMYEDNPSLTVQDITATIGNSTCKGLQVVVHETLTDVAYYIQQGQFVVTLRFLVSNADEMNQLLPAFYTF